MSVTFFFSLFHSFSFLLWISYLFFFFFSDTSTQNGSICIEHKSLYVRFSSVCETEGNLLFPFSFRRSERETSKAISKQYGRGRMGVFCAEAAAVFPLPSVALSQLRIKRKQGIEFENTCFLFFFLLSYSGFTNVKVRMLTTKEETYTHREQRRFLAHKFVEIGTTTRALISGFEYSCSALNSFFFFSHRILFFYSSYPLSIIYFSALFFLTTPTGDYTNTCHNVTQFSVFFFRLFLFFFSSFCIFILL